MSGSMAFSALAATRVFSCVANGNHAERDSIYCCTLAPLQLAQLRLIVPLLASHICMCIGYTNTAYRYILASGFNLSEVY